MTDLISRILPRVQKPARYTGGEYNEIIKDKSQVEIRVAFRVRIPNEIGMSNVGMRILYGVINEYGWACGASAPLPPGATWRQEMRKPAACPFGRLGESGSP